MQKLMFQFPCTDQRVLTVEGFRLSWTPNGWLIHHPIYWGPVGPSGQPQVQRCIQAHGLHYLPALGDLLEELWMVLRNGDATEMQIQESLDAFSRMFYS